MIIMPHLCQHPLYTGDIGYFRMLFAMYKHIFVVVPLKYFLVLLTLCILCRKKR
jgi:hypothetical protein